MPRRKQPVTRSEALELLSRHMRDSAIAPNVLVKLTTMYAKIAGWKHAPEPEDETDINRLIAAEERKRKLKTQ